MEQKIVIHMKDGKIHKGITQDFEPDRGTFHFLPGEGGGVPMRLELERMKAVFWVKDYIGNRHFVARREFGETRGAARRPAVVTFEDGEEMWGTVGEVSKVLPGFFFFPGDKEDNNIRIFVIHSAVRELRLEDPD